MKNEIKKRILELTKLYEAHSEQIDFTDEELKNITYIRVCTLFSKAFDKHRDRISDEGVIILSEEITDAAKQTIKIFTGIDIEK